MMATTEVTTLGIETTTEDTKEKETMIEVGTGAESETTHQEGQKNLTDREVTAAIGTTEADLHLKTPVMEEIARTTAGAATLVRHPDLLSVEEISPDLPTATSSSTTGKVKIKTYTATMGRGLNTWISSY